MQPADPWKAFGAWLCDYFQASQHAEARRALEAKDVAHAELLHAAQEMESLLQVSKTKLLAGCPDPHGCYEQIEHH